MFDDRLFDVIMGEMMSTFGPEVRTDEGSLAYNACAKIAMKLEEVYGDMSEISDNILPDRQDETHLIEFGTERGVKYHYATYPTVKAVFKQEIEIGERFSCNDFIYEVTEKISEFTYLLTCETEGTEANANMGSLEPVEYIDEYQGGEITDMVALGDDDEDIEDYRKRVIQSFKSIAFGGNKADYRGYINAMQGVGGCKPMRREAGSEWIDIYVIDSNHTVPSQSLIEQIQAAVDPEQNHGEGDGMAPICHNVRVRAVSGVPIDVSTKITFDTGYSASTSKEAITKAIGDYLEKLRNDWEENEINDMVVRVSQFEARILSVEGVLDAANTGINGKMENLVLDYTKLPLMGGVTIV